MSEKRNRLVERRERLVALAAAQRRALARDMEQWRMPLALADQGLAALRYIRIHPQWLIVPVVLVAALRPRRVGRWLGSGWVSWRVMRRLLGK
jgi:predicted signal transduction protein with EAL and GGDEF domain